MTFPDQKYVSVGDFTDDYFARLTTAAASVDRQCLERATKILGAAYQRRASVYVCGNGGSAAISNHLVCDHLKGVQTDTDLRPRVFSLSSNIATITAIANDIAYDEAFVYQLRILAEPGDVLITVSASGNSENIVRACQWAKDEGLEVIAMTGFTGGRSAEIASVDLHVEGDNYGLIEDIHQSLMHVLAQFLRQEKMDLELIRDRKF